MRASVPSAWLRAGALLLALLLLSPHPFLRPLADAFQLAQTATDQHDYATAAQTLGQAADRLPYSGYVAYRAGLAAISAQEFNDALRLLQRSAALDGWTPNKHVAVGDAYFGLNQRVEAVAEWELARVDLPTDDNLLARLASNYEALGHYPEAIATLRALAQLRQTDPAVYYRLALLTAVTTPDDALAQLLLVAELSPELAPAANALQQAIEVGQSVGDEAYTFGRIGFALIQLNEAAMAELALTRAVTSDPTYADAYAYLGVAQDMQGRSGRAAYDQALQLAPDSALFHFLLARHLRQAGETDLALEHIQRAQALDPQNPGLTAELGATYAALGDLTQAEIWYVNAVKLNERDPEFWLLLARFYTDHDYHMPELGLPAARQAVSLAPENAQALDVLGFALVLTNDLVNGQKMLEQALTLDPNLPSAYYHLGEAYARQGHWTEAEVAFQNTIRLDAQGPYGALAVRALARYAP